MRNTSVKLLFEFGPMVQQEMCLKRFLIYSSGPLAALLFSGVEPFVQLW